MENAEYNKHIDSYIRDLGVMCKAHPLDNVYNASEDKELPLWIRLSNQGIDRSAALAIICYRITKACHDHWRETDLAHRLGE